MTSPLVKLFIKDYDNTGNPAVRRRYGILAGVTGICANFLLFVVKIVIGLSTASVAVTADAVNNLSDCASSVLTLVGFKLSGKPADKDHPYGHARLEYLFGLFVSVAVTVIGIQMLLTGAEKLFSGGEETVFSTVSIIIMAASVFVKIWMALLVRGLGKKIDSAALLATSADSVSDVITTTAIVAGMFISRWTGPYTDAILGCAVAVYIIILGIRLIKETSDPLLGVAPDPEQIKAITDKILSYNGVLGVHDMVVHSYGAGKTFVSIHVEVDAHRDIMESHDMIDNIETELMREMNIELVVHMDPIHTDDEHLNSLRCEIKDMLSDLSGAYGCEISMHDLRLVIGPSHTNVLFDIALPSGSKVDAEELCHIIGCRLKEIDECYNAVVTVDKDYTSRRYE